MKEICLNSWKEICSWKEGCKGGRWGGSLEIGQKKERVDPRLTPKVESAQLDG